MKKRVLAFGALIIFSSISFGQSQSNPNGTITQNSNSWNPFAFLLPNPQEAAAMQKVLDAQKELDAIKLKIADATAAKTEEDKKKAEAAKMAAAQAPTA